MSKLLVIRGNSGSGKSTVAKKLVQLFPEAQLIEQDYYIKYMSDDTEKEKARRARIFSTVLEALNKQEIVIVEGVFDSRRYYDYFTELISEHPNNNYFVYIDVNFNETLNRHAGRDKKDQFGEEKMTEWYIPHDAFDFPTRIDISQNDSLNETITKIMRASGLNG